LKKYWLVAILIAFSLSACKPETVALGEPTITPSVPEENQFAANSVSGGTVMVSFGGGTPRIHHEEISR
jgi:hypothetical protein